MTFTFPFLDQSGAVTIVQQLAATELITSKQFLIVGANHHGEQTCGQREVRRVGPRLKSLAVDVSDG